MTFSTIFQMMLSGGPIQLHNVINNEGNYEDCMYYFLRFTVPTGGLAL